MHRPVRGPLKPLESAAPLKQDCPRDEGSGNRTGDRETAARGVLRPCAAYARASCPGMGPPDRGRRPKRKATPNSCRINLHVVGKSEGGCMAAPTEARPGHQLDQ